MSVTVIRRACPDCGQHRPFEKQKPNHVLHLILSCCTLGCWLLVWFGLVIMNVLRPYRCRECGGKAWL